MVLRSRRCIARGPCDDSGRTMAPFDLRTWLAAVRRSKLSTRLTIIFVAAIVLPWCAYAWLTISERSAHVNRTERHLSALAAAYGQHAATLMQRYAPGEVDDGLAGFREGLNVPNVSLSLGRRGSTPAADDVIVADADISSVGLAARASMREGEALQEWQAGAYTQAVIFLQ